MKLYKKIIITLLAFGTVSCESFFEKTPDNMLEGDDNYTERSNIYASFMGLLGTLQDVAPKLLVASELQGDLVSPTDQAPDSYWEVFRYNVRKGNEVADPAPLYRVVMNCNDFLRNTIEYNRSYPEVIPVNTYRQMIAGAVTLRTWAYLNIGKLYGEAVYYDYAMTGEVDLAKLPVLKLDELVPVLIDFMNTGVDNVNGNRRVDIDDMFGVTGTVWRRLAISPDALMCELYLWNKDYQLAAKRGINLITGQALLDAGDLNNLTLSYKFGKLPAAGKAWETLFSEVPTNDQCLEGLTIVTYDNAQRQLNPLFSLCSPMPEGTYYVKPSLVITGAEGNIYEGKDYKSGNTTVVDPRGDEKTYSVASSTWMFSKYTVGRTITTQDAPIYIYRAAEIHLMIIEALTAMGNYDAADAMLNVGFAPYHVKDNRFNPPFDAPIYAFQKLSGGRGVRGRLEIPAVYSTDPRFMKDLTPGTGEYNERRQFVLDSLIVQETGRELALEGKRWFTLMRIARNTGNAQLLADLTSKKFVSAERPSYHARLMDPQNWFVDYDLDIKKTVN